MVEIETESGSGALGTDYGSGASFALVESESDCGGYGALETDYGYGADFALVEIENGSASFASANGSAI